MEDPGQTNRPHTVANFERTLIRGLKIPELTDYLNIRPRLAEKVGEERVQRSHRLSLFSYFFWRDKLKYGDKFVLKEGHEGPSSENTLYTRSV